MFSTASVIFESEQAGPVDPDEHPSNMASAIEPIESTCLAVMASPFLDSERSMTVL
jgi:hypothetical protein